MYQRGFCLAVRRFSRGLWHIRSVNLHALHVERTIRCHQMDCFNAAYLTWRPPQALAPFIMIMPMLTVLQLRAFHDARQPPSSKVSALRVMPLNTIALLTGIYPGNVVLVSGCPPISLPCGCHRCPPFRSVPHSSLLEMPPLISRYLALWCDHALYG